MSFVNHSKMKHIYAKDIRRDDTWYGLKPTTQSGDHSMITSNSKYFAVPCFGGGGPVYVGRQGHPTRVDARTPLVYGHGGSVTDTAWNPFNDDMLVTGGTDSVIKLWQIPENGVTQKLTADDALNSLQGHGKRILFVEFHPCAENVLASADFSKEVFLWDITRSDPVKVVSDIVENQITDLKWNHDGSLIGIGVKDKSVRVFDPRLSGEAMLKISKAHNGPKAIKIVFDKHGNLLTWGSGNTQREAKVWDPRMPEKPKAVIKLGKGAGTFLPWYDEALNMIFVGEKGSDQVKVFEYCNHSPYYNKIATLSANMGAGGSPKGMCMAPKLACDVMQSEVARLMFVGRDNVVPAYCLVPRRSKQFQEDLFPNDRIGKSSLTAEEYFSGNNAEPILGSMNPKMRGNIVGGSKTFKKAKGVKELSGELETANARIRLLEAEIESMKKQLE